MITNINKTTIQNDSFDRGDILRKPFRCKSKGVYLKKIKEQKSRPLLTAEIPRDSAGIELSRRYIKSLALAEISFDKLGSTHEKENKTINNIIKLSDLYTDKYELYDGCNRLVFINSECGHGIKILKEHCSKARGLYPELVLNNIYKSQFFYNGFFSEYTTDIVHVINDEGDYNEAIKFNSIKNFEKLKTEDKIPAYVFKMLINIGLIHTDVKCTNFIKIKHGDEYFYIPIDGKLILNCDSYKLRNTPIEKIYGTDHPCIDWNLATIPKL